MKEAEERKNEILDAASELFGQKGFDGTSTADLLEKVGIARGTLYYHFKSKEDIMDALIARFSSRMLGDARAIAADKSIPVLERIVGVVLSLNVSQNQSDGQEMIAQMHNPQNALMHQKTQKVILAGVTPILTEVIQDGIAEGLFRTPYPYECMEMVMTYTNTVFDGDDLVELTEEGRNSRIQAFIFNIERLLDAQTGSLANAMMRIFDGGT